MVGVVRVGVVGSGALAQVRCAALSAVPGTEVVAVASRRLERAQQLADRWGARALTRYQDLSDVGVDAVLVALPHQVQDEVVAWALDRGLHVLAGGPLASSYDAALPLVEAAARAGVVLEAGYEARYKEVWHRAHDVIGSGGIGEVVCVRSVALFAADPSSWYYEEEASGGMLVTHLTYAFLNPLRWLLGQPVLAGAAGGRTKVDRPGSVRVETVAATLVYPGGVPASVTASYVKPATVDGWQVSVLGTAGAVEMDPGDQDGGHLVHHREGEPPVRHDGEADGFDNQARAFVAAVRGDGAVANPPADALLDLQLCAEMDRRIADVGLPGARSAP